MNSNVHVTAWSHKEGSGAGGPGLATASHPPSEESNQCQGRRPAVVNYIQLPREWTDVDCQGLVIGRYRDKRVKACQKPSNRIVHNTAASHSPDFCTPAPANCLTRDDGTELGEHKDKSEIFAYGSNTRMAYPAWHSWIGGLAGEEPWCSYS